MSSDSDKLERLDQLAYEITRRIRDGERPQIEEYLTRYPDLADDIRELFPFLANFEVALHDIPLKREFALPIRAPQISGYRMGRRLGRGGMGVVYEAEHQSLRRRVAVKVLAASMAHDSTARERFRREARSAGRLHHTNIVPIYEVGEDGDTLYYSMQLIDGHNLDRVIDEIRRLRIENKTTPSPAPAKVPDTKIPEAGLGDRLKAVSDVDLARSLLRDELRADNLVRRADVGVASDLTSPHQVSDGTDAAIAAEVAPPVSMP
jgi:hypothetical protein